MLIVSVNIIVIIQTMISIITVIIVTITIATTMAKLGKPTRGRVVGSGVRVALIVRRGMCAGSASRSSLSTPRGGQRRAHGNSCLVRND